MTSILFLREEKPEDEYRSLFESNGYQVGFQQVLNTVYTNPDLLKSKMETIDNYSGLIFTSQKAAEALSSLNIRIESIGMKAYVVGSATAKVVNSLGLDPIGQESGTASILADYIISNHKSSDPLLFLIGDKTKPELPVKLQNAGIKVETFRVYETGNIKLDTDVHDSVVVLFSPSGLSSLDLKRFHNCRWMSIGPVTRDALLQQGIESNIARSPKPQGILAALYHQ